MKKLCKYGAKCYRNNPDHLKEFDHPDRRVDQRSESPPKKKLCLKQSPDKLADRSEISSECDQSCPADSTTTATATATTSSTCSTEDSKATSIDDNSNEVCLLPDSPCDVRAKVEQKYQLQMPEDFYSFVEFCRSLNSEHPEEALSVCDLILAGPFRVLLGLTRGHVRSTRFYLTYCRFYYDPPEFQTVIYGSEKTGYHLGYFRDCPDQLPCLVMANNSGKDAKFQSLGDNLFAAVNSYIVDMVKSSVTLTPFQRAAVSRIQTALKAWAVSHGEFTLEVLSPAIRARQKRVVARTLQNIGVVVPYDKKTELGYRDLGENHASLRQVFGAVANAASQADRAKAYDSLHHLVTNVQFANDEGDPGAGLELGLNAFGYGSEALHRTVRHLLPVAYQLLDRAYFGRVITEHLEHRRHGVPPL